MLSGVCVGTNDLEAASLFYDRVLATIGMSRCFENEIEVGFASTNNKLTFWVLTPYDAKPASFGNGTQLIFTAPDTHSVDAFHKATLDAGGSDEGAPGPRCYREGYYGAYCRDLDGNKLHAYCICHRQLESSK